MPPLRHTSTLLALVFSITVGACSAATGGSDTSLTSMSPPDPTAEEAQYEEITNTADSDDGLFTVYRQEGDL